MKRELNLFIEDILESINAIKEFSKDIDKEELNSNRLKRSAIIREIEVIGEAVKNIPKDFKNKHKEIEWRKISGLRDIIIHAYFNIDLDIMWSIIKKDIPILEKQMRKIRDELKEES